MCCTWYRYRDKVGIMTLKGQRFVKSDTWVLSSDNFDVYIWNLSIQWSCSLVSRASFRDLTYFFNFLEELLFIQSLNFQLF